MIRVNLVVAGRNTIDARAGRLDLECQVAEQFCLSDRPTLADVDRRVMPRRPVGAECRQLRAVRGHGRGAMETPHDAGGDHQRESESDEPTAHLIAIERFRTPVTSTETPIATASHTAASRTATEPPSRCTLGSAAGRSTLCDSHSSVASSDAAIVVDETAALHQRTREHEPDTDNQ